MNFKLAVNCLAEVKELLDEGKISYIEYIKLYSLNSDISSVDWAVKYRDVLYHGFDSNGSSIANEDLFDNMDIDFVKQNIEKSRTPYLSAHISYDYEIGDNINNIQKYLINNIILNVEKIKTTFNKEIILENIPYKYNLSLMSDPEFIKEIIEKTKCGFLFDTSHARKAADTANISFEKYISKLPMDKMVEIHLGGTIIDENGRVQAPHSKMNEEDYEFLEYAIKSYEKLKIITLEYGPFERDRRQEEVPFPLCSFDKVNDRAKEEIYEQLERIKKIIK